MSLTWIENAARVGGIPAVSFVDKLGKFRAVMSWPHLNEKITATGATRDAAFKALDRKLMLDAAKEMQDKGAV